MALFRIAALAKSHGCYLGGYKEQHSFFVERPGLREVIAELAAELRQERLNAREDYENSCVRYEMNGPKIYLVTPVAGQEKLV